MTNKKINTTELDFDLIKSNLKDFLKGQSTFQDYDFEGSALSILLDVLAYNTHYNALYTNLAVNESFLDSASKRSSVVSLAKALGYVPDSAHGAMAYINLTVRNTNSTPTVLNLPKYTPFAATVNDKTYTFYTLEEYNAIYDSVNNLYIFENIKIVEGTPLTYKYEVSDSQKYILPNNDIDFSTINVRVQQNSTSSIFQTFTRNENIIELTSTSPVYFLKEIEGQNYELEFGNGVIGKKLETGNIVNIEYLVCNKEEPNGAKLFTYQGPALLGANPSVTTLIPAQNGYDKEGIDTIRYNAPRAYSTQNRGVTVNDYRSIILQSYGEADSVNIWGGEDNVPPVYGQVFIAIKPKTTETLSTAQKELVVNSILRAKNVLTIKPVIVDPEYINLEVDVTVYYNPKVTNRKENDIKSLVLSTIADYNDQYLNSFDGIFRFSKFTAAVDATESSIVSNITTVKLHRIVIPKYNVLSSYKIELGNPIYGSGLPEESILSSGFYIAEYPDLVVYLEDLPTDTVNGQLRLFYRNASLEKQYIKTFGSVNYTTGSINIESLNIIGIAEADFKLIIKPQSNDVVSIRNQLVNIHEDLTNVIVIADKVASGDSAGNSNYIFTTSRN